MLYPLKEYYCTSVILFTVHTLLYIIMSNVVIGYVKYTISRFSH